MPSLLFCNKSFQLYYSGAQAREARQWSIMGKIDLGSLSMREMLVKTHVCPPVQTVVVEAGKQDSLWGLECSGNFPWEIAWQRCISNPRFFGGKSY